MISAMVISSGQQQVAVQGASRARLVRGRLWRTATVMALVVAGVSLALGLVGVVPSASLGPASSQRQDAGFVLSAIALVVLAVVVVRVARAGWSSASGWVYAPTSSREQRARALAAVRHDQAVPGPELALTVAVAEAAAREGTGVLMWVAISLILAGGALGMAPWWLALMMAAVAAMGVLTVITVRDARAARSWLEIHHSPIPGSV